MICQYKFTMIYLCHHIWIDVGYVGYVGLFFDPRIAQDFEVIQAALDIQDRCCHSHFRCLLQGNLQGLGFLSGFYARFFHISCNCYPPIM